MFFFNLFLFLNFNAKCVKFEIFHDHCSFILDDKNQTACLIKFM